MLEVQNAKVHDPALGQMPMRYAVQREQTNKLKSTKRLSTFKPLCLLTFAATPQPIT
jgi:hypothetical protein